MRDSYLVFGQPLIEEQEIAEVAASMRAAWLGTGPKVMEFERQIANYKSVKYAIAVNSCTAGLHLSCLALGLQPGDEVIAPAMTFCATINSIIHAGATPVLVDVEPDTFNMCPDKVRSAITPRTKAILPVHFAGRCCNMAALLQIAKQHNLRIIEDCAHAIETEVAGKKAGTFGECGVLSFYSTKNIVTGEGGMVLTNNDNIAARAKILALHGMSHDAWKRFSDSGYKHYDVVEIGFKYNMMDLQAAIGIHQLKRVDAWWERRRQIWQRYIDSLKSLPVILPAPVPADHVHAYHLFTVIIPEENGHSRDGLMLHLHEARIGTGVHYRSIPEYTVYKDRFGWTSSAYPNSARIGRSTISLPLSPKLTDNDVDDVIRSVSGYFSH